MSVATLAVDLVARTDQFRREMDSAAQKIEQVGERMQRAGRAMTTRVTLPLVAVGAAAVKMSVDAEESANKFNVVMGAAAESVRARFRELHDTIPLTTAEMEGLAAGVQDLLVPLGLARGEAANMSADMVELAGDLASFNNVAASDALEAMKSALAGSSEPMRRFGVDTRETRLQALALSEGLIEQGEALDGAARGYAVLMAIQQDSADAMGDAARTADSAANVLRFLWRNTKETAQAFGDVLVPAVIPVAAHLSRLVQWVGELTETQRRWVAGIAAVVAAVGPLLFGLGGLVKLLPIAAAGFAALVSPAGLAVAAIVALGTTVYAVATKWDEIRVQAELAMGAVVSIVADAVIAVARWFEGLPLIGDRFREAREQAEAELEKFMAGVGSRVAGLEAEIAAGFAGGVDHVAEFGAALEEALKAGEDAASGSLKALSEINDAHLDRVGILTDALDLGLLESEVLGEIGTILDSITAEMESGNLALDRRVELLQTELGLREALLRATGDPSEGGLANAGGVPGRGPVMDVDALIESTRRSAQTLMSTGRRVAQDTAASFEINWTAAISQIGASLGGLASQAANVATAFLTGGPAAGIPALGGMIGGMISGNPSATQDEYNRALEDFAALGEEASRVQQRLNANYEGAANTILTGLEALTGASLDFAGQLPRNAAELEAFVQQVTWTLEQMGYSASEMEAVIAEVTAEMAANIEDMRDSFRESIELRLLEARGMDEEADAMRLNIDRQAELAEAMELGGLALVGMLTQLYKLEDAARAAAQAEEEAAQARQDRMTAETTALDFLMRAAELAGDDMAALAAQMEIWRIGEMAKLRDLFDREIIDAEQFAEFADVLDQQVTQALRDAAQVAREAAAAERARQRAMHDNLMLEFLQLAGREAEAQALQNQLEMTRLMEQGASAATLALLAQVQAMRAQADAAEVTARSADAAASSMNRMTGQLHNVPSWVRMSARQFQATAPAMRSSMSGGTTQITDNSRIEILVTASDAQDIPALVDDISAEVQRRRRRTGRNPFADTVSF